MKLLKHLTGLLLAAGFLIGMQANTASAGLAVSPLKQEVVVKPGEEGKFHVTLTNRVRNEKDQAQSAHVTLSDVQVGLEGALNFKDPGTCPQSASKWITLEKTDYTLDPGASQQIEFTIKLPLSALPGEYYSALIISLGTKGKDAKGMTIEYRFASGIFLTIPGRTLNKQAKIESCEVKWPATDAPAANPPETPKLQTVVHNKGQGRFDITGKVAVFNDESRLVFAGPLFSKRPCVFAGDRRAMETALNKPLAAGKYTVKITADYQNAYASLRHTMPLEITEEQATLMQNIKKRSPTDATGLAATPEKASYTIPAGGSRTFSISLKNSTDFSVNCVAGIFVVEGAPADAWIALPNPDISIAKGGKRTLGVTIQVPAGTPSGKYSTNIALEGGPEGADPSTLLVPVDIDVKAER